ncbi:hypothetical protein NBRC10512_002331 [Rhodotorula toruloides]
MARNSTSKGPRSSSPSKSSSTAGDNPGLSAWREFYAVRPLPASLLARAADSLVTGRTARSPEDQGRDPNMKGRMVQKRVSTLYRKWKEEKEKANE